MKVSRKNTRSRSSSSISRSLAVLAVLVTAWTVGGVSAEEAPAMAPPATVERQGIEIVFKMRPVNGRGGPLQEGDPASFSFQITDTATGTPLSGVYPAAWMDRKPADEPSGDPKVCQKKVEAFIGGSVLSPPELDLNVYYVLALNDDASISVVDPLFGFGTTKLLDMVFLDAPGEDWALSADQRTLFVTQPAVDRVAVVDTTTWDVTRQIDVAPAPRRAALQGDGRYLWVGHEGPVAPGESAGVTVIDTVDLQVVKTLATGDGRHELAFSDGDRYAFVTNERSGTVSVIDVASLSVVRTVAVGREPASIAYSPTADAAYVTSRVDGTVAVIDGRSHEVVTRAEAEPGLGQIRFAPGGQLAFIVNPEADVVHILDAATGRIVQTGDVEDGPDHVAFSDHLAYIRHRGSETVLMVPLEQIGREGAPLPVVDFPGGHAAFGKGARPSPADGIVQAPGATAVLVANPADRAIYFYKEGMAAPMGHFQNYERQPRAVLALDRSLAEHAPGTYETIATLRRPGRYDVAFFLDSPRTVHCFEVTVAESPELAAARVREMPVAIEPLVDERVLPVGEKVAFRFRLIDVATGAARAGVDDVRVLTFRSPGLDQRRLSATPVGDGIYQVELEPAIQGLYYLLVESQHLGVSFSTSPQLIYQAKAGAAS